MLIVDSQVHIWGADTPERAWDRSRPARPHRPGAFTADELGAEMEAAGVSRAILIPPSWEGDRNDLALEAARGHPDRFAVAGRLPLEAPDLRGIIRDWLEPGMKAVRLTLRTPQELRLLADPDRAWVWAEIQRAGAPVMLYPNERTTDVHVIARRHPGLRMVIDHMGLRRAKDEAALAGLPDLLAMAALRNVAVKASCLPFYTTDPYPFRRLHAPLRQVIDAFGPDRVFWGSDMTRLPCSYRDSVRMFTEELEWLDGDAKAAVMGRSLCAWLDWPAE